MIIRSNRHNLNLRPGPVTQAGALDESRGGGGGWKGWSALLLLPVLLLLLALACGCQTADSKAKKRLSTMRIHLETNSMGPTNRMEKAHIELDPPVELTVEKMPFLVEGDIKEAKVLDMMGGFSLRLEFNRRGSWLLEQYSVSNRGRRIAIFCQYTVLPGEHLNEGRWLAAPRIQQRITDGVLIFTPQATREEADQIVFGLNNVAKKLKTSSEW